jgi:hypothetical protein
MAYQYPPAPPSLSGDVETISRFLSSPTQVQRRLRSLAEQRYIADRILTGRFNVEGGAILYETGETIFADAAPLAVAAGAEYPLVGLSTGTASLAKVVKWGQDTLITDESIKRRGADPLNRGLAKLVNQNVKTVDATALSAVASAVTQATAAAADWTTAATGAQILKDVLLAKANVLALNQGYDPDVVVVDDINYASAAAAFTAAGYFPREDRNANPALAGTSTFMEVGGLLWLPTPNVPTANVAIVLDSTQLGGMADENLGGPGYTRSTGDAPGVESKTIRDDDNDQWRLRVRRVTVPVVLEPAAAWKITGI